MAITAKELKNDEGRKYCEILKQFWIKGAEGGNTITRDNLSNSSATQLDGTRSIKRCYNATSEMMLDMEDKVNRHFLL